MVVVQLLSRVSFWLHGLKYNRLLCPSYLSEFAQTHRHCVGDAIQPSCPLPSPSLLFSTFPSIRVFSNESALHIRWPKYWRSSISPSNEYSGLISFRIDWFDLLAVQGTLKSLLQHHNSKAFLEGKLWQTYTSYYKQRHHFADKGLCT